MSRGTFILLAAVLLGVACSTVPQGKTLPILGPVQVVSGEGKTDTLYHRIPPFSLLNQDSLVFNQDSLNGRIYLVDFFFTTCPTICPKMTLTMQLLYERLKEDDRFVLISHTIDPKNDGPSALKAYAQKQGVINHRWQFLTGPTDSIFSLAERYLAFAKVAPEEEGGFTHSGFIMLMDDRRQIRAVYDGTRSELTDSIYNDIQILFNE
jgi:protein SCO1/2